MNAGPVLNSGLDLDRAASAFARDARVHIRGVLTTESAAQVHRCLKQETDFALTKDGPDRALYDAHLLSNAGEAYPDAAHYLSAVSGFLNSQAFLDMARQITGNRAIAFADAEATRYRPGHFRSRQDDANAPGSVAAYALNLTSRWRPDWGGALLFCDRPGHFSGGYLPAFNALNIFAVPQEHMVGLVSPFAGADYYAITGRFRTQ
jgi:SM-20-related protein